MVKDELLTELRKLTREEKRAVYDWLAGELHEEPQPRVEDILQPGVTYEVWSPYEAYDAADALLGLLEEEQRKQNDK